MKRAIVGADYTARFARRPAPDRVQRRRILPRSRHLPLASTEGSVTRKVNKTVVRLWSGYPQSARLFPRSSALGESVLVGTAGAVPLKSGGEHP